MLPLIMAICGAAGAVAGVLTTQAVNEKDRQAVKRYEKVNAELINSRDKLQQRYYELSDKSQRQIKDLNLKLAESEMEKDLVYLALNLYHELMALREDIDINPCLEVLVEFHKAIVLTNYVLQQLDKRLVPVTQDYFSRTLTRIDERDNLSKEQLFSFMAVLMNPQHDTVTSLLGEVQNEMFSQQYTGVKQQNDSDNHTARDEVYEELKDYQAALADCTKAIELDPNDADNYIAREDVYEELKDYQAALADYNKAIKLDPNDADNYMARGDLHDKLENYRAALADYNKAEVIFHSLIKLRLSSIH
ncbi:MAG: tetratricopeptide repeat protein [Waterburya sp.]